MDSRGVEQDQFQPGAARHPQDAPPGGLGFSVNRRKLGADQTVQQRGLPGAREPHQRHEAGPVSGAFGGIRFRRRGGHSAASNARQANPVDPPFVRLEDLDAEAVLLHHFAGRRDLPEGREREAGNGVERGAVQ